MNLNIASEKVINFSVYKYFVLFVVMAFPQIMWADDFVPEQEDDVTFSANNLTLDGDNTGGDVQLQFGATLAESLEWDSANSRFSLSDDLDFSGNELVNIRIENLATPPVCGATEEGKIYFNTTDKLTYSCDGAGVWNPFENALNATIEFPVVQARRTTSFTLPTTYGDVDLDTTDLENDATTLDHDDTLRDRIDIGATAMYQIIYGYTAGGSAGSTHEARARVRVNDTTVLPGSESVNKNYQSEFSTTSASFLANLNDGDFISLQLQRDNTTDVTQDEIYFSIIKLEGIKGDPGPAGAPGADGVDGIDGADGAPGADGDITWEGAWVSQNYTANQAVSYLGSSYVCIVDTVSNEDPTDGTYWELLAAAGVAGSGTDDETFTLDQDDTGGDVTLKFGNTLAEFLRWDTANSRFSLSDDLALGGVLQQDGNTFTLDADNGGSGANVSIVAEQGSDNNGELRYNASTNRWELNNNNSGFENITSIYGTEFNLFESAAVSTSTSTGYTNKINTTTSNLPAGTYRLTVSYNWNVDSTTGDFVSRILFDGTNLDAANNNEMHRQEAKDSAGTFDSTATDQKYGFTKTYYVTVGTAGTKTVQLQWASSVSGTEASLWNANIEVIRVQ